MTEGRRPEQRIPMPGGRQGEPSYQPGKRRPGRPTTLTPAVEEKYFAARRAGNTIADSARYAGLSVTTVEKWLRRGRGAEPGRPPKPEFVRFYRMDEEARAAVKVLVVGNLVARSRVDHNAALAYLRVHGGPEWSGDPYRPDPSASPGVGQPAAAGPTLIDQSQATFLLLPREAVPDLVHQMLDIRRRELAAAEPVNVTPIPEPPRRNGDSRTARNGLRVDADPED